MRIHCIPSAWSVLLDTFEPVFTAPGFRHFVVLLTAWVQTRGRHTLTRVLRAARGLGYAGHHATWYRFLSAGRWSLDAVGAGLVRLLESHLESDVVAIVDDTLCHKCGTQICGTGVHHDASRSSYNRRGRRITVFRFGHQWVVLALWLPCPWNRDRGWAVPVLFRLYRPKARCLAKLYRKRTELAAEMIALLASWLSPGRRLLVVGDAAYCCKPVLRSLPPRVDFIGPLRLDAALYERVSDQPRTGRRRTKGCRIANPRTLASQPKLRTSIEARLYGRDVAVEVVTRVCIWYPSAGTNPVRIVVSRDPKGRAETRAFVSTRADLGPGDVLALYSRRWQLEVTFREIKQLLGFEDPQNGFWRRRHGKRADTRKKAAKSRSRHERIAATRTAPLAGVVHTLVLLWYVRRGHRLLCPQRLLRRAPWHRHKHHPSFADIRDALASRIKRRLFRRILANACIHPNRLNLEALEEIAA